jgi:hypothetical protein
MDGEVRVKVINVVVIGKHAVFTSDDTGDEITLLIGISHTLLVDDSLSGSGEVAPHHIEAVLYFSNLIKRHWCPGVTLDTTLALADAEVTAELLRQDL